MVEGREGGRGIGICLTDDDVVVGAAVLRGSVFAPERTAAALLLGDGAGSS